MQRQSKKETNDLKMVNIHQVNGDVAAINFLKNADFHWVEGLFLRAKQTGRTEFDYLGVMYEMVKNRNLTYTVRELPEKVIYLDSD